MRAPRSIGGDRRFLLAAVLAAGLLLRLVDAGTRLSHDEGYSWLVATAPDAGAFLSRLARYENTPPLFYLLLCGLPLDSELWLRLPSLIASVLAIGVLYAIVLPILGTRAALLAALGLAVAPYAVSFSDYSRGFMVAGLGLLVALLALQRLAGGGAPRWWWVYASAGTWAMYAEYYAGLYLLSMLGALLALDRMPRRVTLLRGSLPLVAFLPWAGQLARSVNHLGSTKLSAPRHVPTPGSIRDAVVPLVFGEHGSAVSTVLRSVQAIAVIGALAWGCARLRRAASPEAFWLLAGTLAGATLLQLAAAVVGPDVFAQRYLTTVIGLAAAVLAGAVSTIPWRWALPAVLAGLAALAVAVLGTRAGREYEPDTAAAVSIVREHGYRTILTNSAVLAFYGRELQVILDRPLGIGAGRERTCAPRCAVVDDSRFGGVRVGPGPRIGAGPLVVRFPPAR